MSRKRLSRWPTASRSTSRRASETGREGSTMALKSYNPVTPSTSLLVLVARSALCKGKPVKGLTEGLTKSGGGKNCSRNTARFNGGGHKRPYGIIDFKRRKFDMTATVEPIEYDPNRT